MKTPFLPAKLILTLLVLTLGAVAAWAATASFMPPAQTGDIFAVINADRSAGVTATQISVKWGSIQRSVIRGNQYGNCAGPMSGWVLLVRHTVPGSQLFTVSTTGTIARAPYQGVAPPEISHSCYKLEKMRLQ
ncbi:MAG TPA: hypothetical protein VEW48_01245 [Thermoanaerobaculia bacterium]|nr:hypothetical protein [Thermoanaerobaculia bacterium]